MSSVFIAERCTVLSLNAIKMRVPPVLKPSGDHARHLLHPLEFTCFSKGSRHSLIPFAPQAMNSEVSPLLWSLRPDGNSIDVSFCWQVAVGWGPVGWGPRP